MHHEKDEDKNIVRIEPVAIKIFSNPTASLSM